MDKNLISEMAKGIYPEQIVQTEAGVFKIKYPSGKDWRRANTLKAEYFGNRPLSSFDKNALGVAEQDTILIVAITAYPDGFPEEFKEDNFIDYPCQEVKNKLFSEFNTFFLTTQKRFSGKK